MRRVLDAPPSFAKGMVVAVLFALPLWALIFYAVHVWASTPVVYFHYANDECAWVASPDASHSCENMPERYETGWVQ